MSDSASPTPAPSLRLVGPDEAAMAAWRRARSARNAVASANVAAATNVALDPTDPRWVLAAHTQAALDGLILDPERRERLVRMAQRIGVRPFEANVIIAIVQDHARCGRSLQDASGVLSLVRRPDERTNAAPGWARWTAALATAALANAFLIWWLLG